MESIFLQPSKNHLWSLITLILSVGKSHPGSRCRNSLKITLWALYPGRSFLSYQIISKENLCHSLLCLKLLIWLYFLRTSFRIYIRLIMINTQSYRATALHKHTAKQSLILIIALIMQLKR